MLYSATSYDFEVESPFDVAIVGAGAVGLSLAIKLARCGLRIALLEAGPDVPQQASQAFFETAKAIGHPLPGLHIGRFRNLGGTTAFWGGQLVPFDPLVFGPRPWVSDAYWPIDINDVAPYYPEVFSLLGMSRILIEDADIWERLNVVPPPTAEAIHPIFTRWAPEPNLAIHFRDEIRDTPNLAVILDAQVGALVVDPQGRVEGVELRLNNGVRRTIRATDVTLANGTIEISRLLQLPDAAGHTPPWASNNWIGCAFIDHVDCYAGSVEPIDRKRFSELFDNVFLDGLKYTPKLRLSDSVQCSEKLLEISSHFVFSSSAAENIANLKILIKGLLKGRIEHKVLGNPFATIASFRFIVPMALRYIRYRRMLNLTDGGIQLRLTAEQRPLRESRIALGQDRDAFGLPEVEVDWKIDPTDLTTIARFAELLKIYLEEKGIARVSLDQKLQTHDPAFLASTDDANHHMGGARMAATPDSGVVDRNCNVFGTPNLYIAGAAVYPTSGFANPTFTAIALGLRLADHLMGKQRKRDDAALA